MEEYIPEKYTVLVLTKFFDRMKGFLAKRPQGCILLILLVIQFIRLV